MRLSQTEEEAPEAQGLEDDSQRYESDRNEEAEGQYTEPEPELDADGNPIEAQEIDADGNPVEATVAATEPTEVQTAPIYWGPGAPVAPTVTDEDEGQFITMGAAKRLAFETAHQVAAQMLQGFEASSAATGYHMQNVTEKAPEFMRQYGPEIRQALASVTDPTVKAKKETTTAAVLTAVLRRANEKGIDAVDALLEAATLIQRGRVQPPPPAKQPNVARQVPSAGGGRSAATVASNRPARPANSNSLMGELFGITQESARDILRSDEANKNKSRY